MPHYAQIEPIRGQLTDAIATVDAALAPAPEVMVRECLAGLAMTMPIDRRSELSAEMFADKAVELLGHVPADLWIDAANECLMQLEWFPSIKQLNDRLTPGLTRRRRLRDRFQRMADLERPQDTVKTGDAASRAADVERIYADLNIKRLNGKPVFGAEFDIPEIDEPETSDGEKKATEV